MSPFPFLKVSSFLSSIFSFFPSFLIDPHFTKLCSGRKYNSSLYIWYMELNSLGKYVQIFKIETKIWKWYVWKLYYLDMSYHGWLGHIKFWVGCRLCPLDSINNVKCNVQRHLTWFHGIWHVVRIELQSMIHGGFVCDGMWAPFWICWLSIDNGDHSWMAHCWLHEEEEGWNLPIIFKL